MENLHLKSFLEYKFLSNLDFNPEGKNLAFSLSESDYEKNSYKHYIYSLNTETKEIRKLTHFGKEKNSLWLNNDIILFSSDRDTDIEEKKKLGETWTLFYALDIKNGGEAYEYMRLPLDVSSIKIVDENNFILLADYDNNSYNLNDLKGEEREKAIKEIEENKDYEVLDEIPFWSNGHGFRNKKRDRLYHYDKLNNKVTPISDEYTNVELVNVKDNKVIFAGRTFTDKQGLTSGLYVYDVKSQNLEVIVDKNLYDISYANFIEDKIICALSDMKAYGVNENHKLYLIDSNKNITLLNDNDTWLSCTVGSDCRLGGGKSFKVIGNKLYFLATIAERVYLKSIDTNGKVEILSDKDGTIDFFDIANEEIYYVGMRDYTLQEIYKLENNESTKLTSFNEEINKKYKISKPEVFDFTTNGATTKGFVIYPVDYDKKFKLKPFHENVDVQCFVGGTWKLIPNNYSGSYSLNGKGDCPMVRQAIKFEVTKNKEFRFKKLQDNVKAKKITEGYVLQLENQQKDSFTLTQSVPFEGEVIKVYYQFQRVK